MSPLPHRRLRRLSARRGSSRPAAAGSRAGCSASFVAHDLAVRQDVAAVGDLEREVHVLLDEQHAAAMLLRELAHERQQPLDDHRARARDSARRAAAASGGRASARATASICCSPPERSPARRRCRSRRLREVVVGDRLVETLAPGPDPKVLGDGEAEEEPATFGHVRDPGSLPARSASCAQGRARRAERARPSA